MFDFVIHISVTPGFSSKLAEKFMRVTVYMGFVPVGAYTGEKGNKKS